MDDDHEPPTIPTPQAEAARALGTPDHVGGDGSNETEAVDRNPLTPGEHEARALAITTSRTYGEAAKKLNAQGDDIKPEALAKYAQRYALSPLGQVGATAKVSQRLKAAEDALHDLLFVAVEAERRGSDNPTVIAVAFGRMNERLMAYQAQRKEIG